MSEEEIRLIIRDELKKIDFNKFTVFLDKIGVFPSENYIRVVWIGLKPEEEILNLHKNIDENLKENDIIKLLI